MLPPPITRHSSTPSACTDWTSSAMRETISGSRPYSRPPISASPDTFSRTRRYLRSADIRPTLIRLAEPHRGPVENTPNRSSEHNPTEPTAQILAIRRALPPLQRKAGGGSSVLQLSSNLCREVGTLPLDTLAEGEPRKACHPNRCTGRLASLLNHPRHLGLLIDDKDLLEQHELLIKL